MTPEYARPEILVEGDWVWEHRDDPSVRIIDRGEAAFRTLPRARPLEVTEGLGQERYTISRGAVEVTKTAAS